MPDIEVFGPNGTSISFPEGTSHDVIHGVMSEHFGSQKAPEPKTNPMEQMTIDFQNQMRAAAQGTTPNIHAHAPNLLSDKVELDEADRPHYKDDNGKLIPFDPQQHVMLQDPADRKLKVFGRSDKTDEGRAAGLGRFLIGGQGTGSIRAATAAPQAIQSAARIGVDVPKAIATESPGIKLLGQTVAKAPGGGPLYRSIEKSTGQIGTAAEKAIETSGGNPKPEIAGQSFERGIEQHFKPGLKEAVGGLYDKVDAGINPNIQTPLQNTKQIAGEIAGSYAGHGNEWTGKVRDLIVNAIQKDPAGLAYKDIKNLRTLIGEMVDTGIFPEGTSQKQVSAIYKGLTQDLENSVLKAGSPQALADWQKANAAFKVGQEWKDKIAKVLGPDVRSEEGVAGTIFRMAQKGASADLSSLAAARKAVPENAWKDITANAISRLGKDKAGTFSPTRFVSDYGNLSDAGKRILFGGSGAGNLIPFLNDINEVSKKFVSAGKFGNPSGTAGHVGMYSALTIAGERLLEGDWKTPMAIIGTAIGVNATSRVLGTASTVASVARWSRAYDAIVHKPGPAAMASFNIATRNLANTAADHIGIPTAAIEQRIKQQMQVAQEGQNQ